MKGLVEARLDDRETDCAVRIGDQEEEGRAGDLFMGGDGDEVWIGNAGRDELILFVVVATVSS